MTWQRQRRPVSEWGIRLERNHDTVNILVINLGGWSYTKSFRKAVHLNKETWWRVPCRLCRNRGGIDGCRECGRVRSQEDQ